jgi:hypothetical protein
MYEVISFPDHFGDVFQQGSDHTKHILWHYLNLNNRQVKQENQSAT